MILAIIEDLLEKAQEQGIKITEISLPQEYMKHLILDTMGQYKKGDKIKIINGATNTVKIKLLKDV